MSDFEIKEVSSQLGKAFASVCSVKPTHERWKDFPICVIPKPLAESLDKVKNFKVFEDDIFLTGYPRSGTTILAEMIWLIANNFDFAKATSVVTDDRVPGLEYDDMTQMIQKGKLMNTFETLSRPRTIKTHLPVQLLPDDVWIKKPKMIYISRDPRDVAVSIYHFGTHYDSKSSMRTVLENFMRDDGFLCPYREHRLNFWNISEYPNILYLTFESVTSNIDDAIRKVSEFLGVTVSNENFQKLKEHLKFDNMKTNTACNNQLFFEKVNQMSKQKTETDDFIRRGKIGGYKDEMPKDLIAKFDEWIAEETQLKAGFPRKQQQFSYEQSSA